MNSELASSVSSRPREQRPFYVLYRVGLAIRSIYEEIGKGEGVTLSQYTLLSLISGSAHMTTAGIARKLQLTPQSVNEMVNSLEVSGYITKARSAQDKRIFILALTEMGKDHLEKAEIAMDRAEKLCFKAVPPELQHQLWGVLRNIIAQEKELTGRD